jgi:hypothetical protein
MHMPEAGLLIGTTAPATRAEGAVVEGAAEVMEAPSVGTTIDCAEEVAEAEASGCALVVVEP